MRLYSHVVKRDRGLAPNPFWGYCTVAVCTLNHMGIQAKEGDWLVGTTPKSRGDKVTYAMGVSEVLSFNEYFNDPRFEKKRPVADGTWRQRCGDNMYYRDDSGEWRQRRSFYHRDSETIRQDLRHPRVFIGEHFYYFGNQAVHIPPEYTELVWRRQGCKRKHDPEIVEGFLEWLRANSEPGVHGVPYDNDEAGDCGC